MVIPSPASLDAAVRMLRHLLGTLSRGERVSQRLRKSVGK